MDSITLYRSMLLRYAKRLKIFLFGLLQFFLFSFPPFRLEGMMIYFLTTI